MKILSHLPKDIQGLIENMAASAGYTMNDYSEIEVMRFIEGAVSMYHFQQNIINRLEVEIDLLEGGIK